ncbi:MAG: ABC transporter ATP-binding protein [Betaproteobacteria bacterium]|nr:ABC transporter ATP-binding protein [Betaproteobacteria bacterium]
MNPSVVTLGSARFSWPKSDAPVLDIERFDLRAGQRLFLHGPSGSGKSTLLNLIAGLVVPQSGCAEVMGQDMGRLSGAARDRLRADHIGFVFQMFNLIPYLSVLENVCLPCGFSTRRRTEAARNGQSVAQEARRLLSHLGLDDEALLRRQVTELSVGQQQRVAAARALIGMPALVIADEPTSALDSAHRDGFLTLLLNECARAGAALLFVSHDIALARHFDDAVAISSINRARAA